MTTTTLKTTRNLSSSSNFASSKTRKNKSLINEARDFLNSNSLDSIEIEYIKNLQQQVYFLDLECNYLRQQLNVNGFHTELKYDKESHNLKHKMKEIELEKNKLETTNQSIYQILEETRNTFDRERHSLAEEMNLLKQEKNESEQRMKQINTDLHVTQTNLYKHHDEIFKSQEQISYLETQLEQIRKDNIKLRAEITDARNNLNNRDTLIKEIQKELADQQNKKNSVHELKSTVNELRVKLTQSQDYVDREAGKIKYLEEDKQRLLKEIANYQQQLSDNKIETHRLNTTLETVLKQNETDLILAKKNANIMKSNAEQLELSLNEHKITINNLNAQMEQSRFQEKNELKNQLTLKQRLRELEENATVNENELKRLRDEVLNKQRAFEIDHGNLTHEKDGLRHKNDELEKKIKEIYASHEETIHNRDKQHELLRVKTETLQKNLEEQIDQLKQEKNNSKQLKLQIDGFLIQDQTNTKTINSLNYKINELEIALLKSELKNNEITNLNAQLHENKLHLNAKDEENKFLRAEIEALKLKLKELDRIKHIESIIQSQHWEEFGTIAENMKHLSRTIGYNSTTHEETKIETSSLQNSFKIDSEHK